MTATTGGTACHDGHVTAPRRTGHASAPHAPMIVQRAAVPRVIPAASPRKACGSFKPNLVRGQASLSKNAVELTAPPLSRFGSIMTANRKFAVFRL